MPSRSFKTQVLQRPMKNASSLLHDPILKDFVDRPALWKQNLQTIHETPGLSNYLPLRTVPFVILGIWRWASWLHCSGCHHRVGLFGFSLSEWWQKPTKWRQNRRPYNQGIIDQLIGIQIVIKPLWKIRIILVVVGILIGILIVIKYDYYFLVTYNPYEKYVCLPTNHLLIPLGKQNILNKPPTSYGSQFSGPLTIYN